MAMWNCIVGLVILCLRLSAAGVVRRYYIAAVEQEWDYAPSGRDLVFNHQSEADLRIRTSKERIGSKYKKAVYKQYTDESFITEVWKPAHQGYVGPTIKAEVGDTVIIVFRNSISVLNRNFSIHPHGIFYTKFHEGALYLDGEAGMAKLDDRVPPGGNFTYVWNITNNFAPAANDDNCIPWGYHSHVDSMMDIETGLVGVLLTCKAGILRHGKRKDVQKEIVLYTDITDETDSHFIGYNIHRCLDPDACRRLLKTNDADFRESNRMYHINGYVYGNLPNLDVCEGENVTLYTFALGNGIHTLQIYGQTFTVKKQRTDAAAIYPATFKAINMVPINEGTWLLICRNNDHLHDGMTAFFNVKSCPRDPRLSPMPETPPGRLRRYFIAAEEITWNYMPGGKDLFALGEMEMDHGFSSSSHHHMHGANHHDSLSKTYKKAVFVEYTDESFTQMKARPLDEEHLHLLGPPIKCEVGDILEVVFFNNASRPYSVFPHGVGIVKPMEGSVYYLQEGDSAYGLITHANSTTVYRFDVPWTAAPTPEDPNCLSYTYHSAVDVRKDTNTGLVGPLLVCKPGSLNEQGKQLFVNKEVFMIFNVIDENLSWYIDDTIREFTPEKMNVDKKDPAFTHGNLIHAINGRIYGTLNAVDMCLGDRVSWHFMGLGSNKDLHGIGIEGNSMAVNGRLVDTRIIIPGIGFTGYMHPDNKGKWALFCHTNHHLMAGMSTTYNVKVCDAPQLMPVVPMRPSGGYRLYYIAAVEVDWNYAPSGIDKIKGEMLNNSKSGSYLFSRKKGGYMGTVYKKAVYREFTDATFKHEVKRGYREIHLGLLGPYIRGEVGDVIVVVFKNKASKPYSIKPHGVFYSKKYEGMKYNDNSQFTKGEEVKPGDTFTYQWTVPDRAGPGENEPNCIGWLYHSGTRMVRDTPTGLFGPLVTCRRGVLGSRNERLDHHSREFALVYYIINENRSWYFRDNLKRIGGKRAPHIELEKSNMMNSINGYIYGNTPGMVMETGEHVTWYVMGLGSEDDYHTVHFHGQTYIHRTAKSNRGDVVEVFPGTYETVDMFTDNPGTWLIHCHVMKHLTHGMEAKYAVVEKGVLKALEDAEKNRKRPIILHKLPAAGGYPDPTVTRTNASPSLNRNVLVLPPSARSGLPILTRNLQIQPFRGVANRASRRLEARGQGGRSRNGASNRQRGSANSELRGLQRSGILPRQLNIQTNLRRHRPSMRRK